MKNTFKLLAVALALTSAVQTMPMSKAFSRLSRTCGARLNALRSARPAVFARRLSTASAVAARPMVSKLAVMKTVAGFGTAAGLALYAKPARAEGPKKEEPKAEITLSKRIEAGMNEGLKLVLAALGMPKVETPRPPVETSWPPKAQSIEPVQNNQQAKAQDSQSAVRPLKREDVDKALGVAKTVLAQVQAEAQLEFKKRRLAYYDCMVNATLNREQLKVGSYSEACRLCAFRTATSNAFYPQDSMTEERIDFSSEFLKNRTEKLSYLFPDTQAKLIRLQLSAAAKEEEAVDLQAAIDAAKKQELVDTASLKAKPKARTPLKPSAPELDAQDKADFAKMAQELVAEQNAEQNNAKK